MATMNATVLDIIAREGLLVRNSDNGQQVRVNFRDTNRFTVGDNVRITYDGRMTFSIPPQITATSIQIVRPDSRPEPAPIETRAIVVRKGSGFLMVRTLRNNRQIRVNYRYANHFCVGQRIIIRHSIMLPIEPPQINAIDIVPIC